MGTVRNTLCVRVLLCATAFVVEDVDGDRGSNDSLRRLFFRSNMNAVQSEARCARFPPTGTMSRT